MFTPEAIAQYNKQPAALTIVAEEVTIQKGNESRPARELYAHVGNRRIGKIINTIAPGLTGLVESPNEDASLFEAVYGGHGDIYHVCDAPPNPHFKSNWGEVFSNPELLPVGTTNVFIDEAA